MSAAGTSASVVQATERSGWPLFAAMFALMVLNFIDRQVIVSMFPHLREEFRLTDGQLGGLVSVVAVAIAIFTVPIAVAADRYGRMRSVFAMACVWSLATIACGWATTAAQLTAARAVVGIGQAAFGAVGAAILASAFPERQRSTVLGAFLAAAVLGSVLGVAVGGAIAERYGWRAAFMIAGFPSLAMALVLLAFGDSGPGPGRPAPERVSLRRIAAELRRPPTFAIVCLAAGLQLFTVAAVYAWLPTFLHRVYGLAPAEAGARAALVILAGGVGTVLWGALADRLGARSLAWKLRLPAVLAIATSVVFVTGFAWMPEGPWQLAAIVAGALMMTCSIGPAAAVVIDVVPSAVRASAASVLALAQNLVGLALGPLVAGWLSDRHGIATALAIVPAASVLAAAAFVAASRSYAFDRAEAAAPRAAVVSR